MQKTTIEHALCEYYRSVEADDLESALQLFHPQVNFTHVWSLERPEKQDLHGAEEVRSWLSKAGPRANSRGLIHTVLDFIQEGEKGAFIAEVTSTLHDRSGRFMVWFETREGLVSRYDMRPL